MTALEFHDIADLFPLMSGGEFNSLKEDIRVNGLHEPIWLYAGKIIDGRNRYRACTDLGIKPEAREYDGDESGLLPFVVSLNLHRRHLTESQRSMIAAKVKERFEADAKKRQAHGQTGPGKSLSANLRKAEPLHSAKEAAVLLNVSPRSVETASHVHRNGTPKLVESVDRGEVSVSAAAEVARLPEPEQEAVVSKGPAAVKETARDLRTARQRAREEEIEQALSQMDDGGDEDNGETLFPEPGDDVPVVKPERVADESSPAAGLEKWRDLLKLINNRLVTFGKAGGLLGMTRGRRKDAIRLRNYLAEIRDRIDGYIQDFDAANLQETHQ